MLFKQHLAKAILEGRKTQTRRPLATPQPRRYHPGSIQPIQTSYFNKPIGYIRILAVRTERLGDITEEDAKAEGFKNLAEFRKAWKQIYGEWNPNQQVTVYTFTLT